MATRELVPRNRATDVIDPSELLADLSKKLEVPVGGTTKDGKITLEFAECIGVCEGAPCVLINDEHRANVTPDKVDGLIAELRQ